MKIAPVPGPGGLYRVSVMPRFLLDSREVGWQGAYFAEVDVAPAGTVDNGHERYCVQRGMHREERRQMGRKSWASFSEGFSCWRPGDEQHLQWRRGGRSQFIFMAPSLVEAVLGERRSLPALGHRQAAGSRFLEALFDALHADLAEGSPAGPLVGDSLIAGLLGHLAATDIPRSKPLASKARHRAIDYIEARLSQPISLQDLAEASGVSVRHFSRAFRETMGVSPHQYLIQRRVEQAKLLIASGTSLAEVAQRCGFSDQSQLTRSFVRHVGASPGVYRAQLSR